jgi:hypothetical protein
LLVRGKDFGVLMPFAESTDVLDLPRRFSAEELARARAGIVRGRESASG